ASAVRRRARGPGGPSGGNLRSRRLETSAASWGASCRRLREPDRGQRDAHAGAASWRAVEGDLAAVEIDDLLDDGHAEPRAGGLGGEERQEDLVAITRRNADAVVDHLDGGAIVLRGQVDRHAPTGLAGRDCLERLP